MHSRKLIAVSGNQSELVLKGMTGNEGIERANGLADYRQILTDL